MPDLKDLPNRQSWQPDTHPEVFHTAWDSGDPDTHVCVGVHVHPARAGRHFLATPNTHILTASGRSIPGATRHEIPVDHWVILDLDHAGRVYEAVLAENRRKNMALATIEANLPSEMKVQEADADGDPLWDLGDGVIVARHAQPANTKPLLRVKIKHQPVWSFDAATGQISIRVPGADDALLAALHRAVQAEHGPMVTVTPAP